MASEIDTVFSKLDSKPRGVIVLLVSDDFQSGRSFQEFDETTDGQLDKAAELQKFKGKKKQTLDIVAPANMTAPRLLLVGTGPIEDMKRVDWVNLGGMIKTRLSGVEHADATILFDCAGDDELDPTIPSELALGVHLRAYDFDKYKTRKKDANKDEKDNKSKLKKLILHCSNPTASRRAFTNANAAVSGVYFARDLVNEPANILNPVEFADRIKQLETSGLSVDVMDEKALAKIGMRALLGVGQGSANESRVAVINWNGNKSKKTKPLVFVGKGVCFDTGGISIKPSAGMEDMKGDMGGAAAVAGLMKTLADRKAKVNAIGIVGLVENMPGRDAQRPGDIVESLSGQTIEIINTDAEGRLVLADLLWYAEEKYKPAFMINLATLTGAIIVSLGKHHAGLFSNDDELAENLTEAGQVSGEKVWRMPLAPEYDKMIDSKFADMKNVGGRMAGSITAAQFLQRFVKDTPWAHLDVAGTAMAAPKSDTNTSWGSGYGVRLLDQLVSDYYEA